MKIDLSGRLAVVTGSTVGIGFAIARGLAEAGAEVVVNGRKQVPVDLAMAKIQKAAPDAKLRGVAADLSTAEGCAALVEAIPRADILVNNVGIFQLQDFFEIPDGEWSRFLETNVMSGVRLSRAYLKEMMVRNWGRIIFISSESALNIPEDMLHYGVTKTAQLAISRGLAKIARGTKVTVNAVLPGPTLSEGVEEMLREGAQKAGKTIEETATSFVKSARPSSIIQRTTTPEEVANMVVFLASPLASATTGAAIRADGGVVETIA
jgi:NAD(P)-dependent dehydrogenase (short-subunit alcohol dehydrogenase family)